MLISDKPIITIKEARKLLGKDFRHLADGQIEDLIALLNSIAIDKIIDSVPN
jgi:hypothetical protein